MLPLIIIATSASAFAGGLLGLRLRNRLQSVLGFSAGVVLGVIAFEILPEIVTLSSAGTLAFEFVSIAFVAGFLTFHTLEKLLLIHSDHECAEPHHHHPSVGVAAALALAVHAMLDGVGIGLGFQVSEALGLLIALAVISHAFTDGLNTVSLMLLNKNSRRRSLILLTVLALAPIAGAVSTLIFTIPDTFVLAYLGFFAGSLLYICAAEILPEAHAHKASLRSIFMTMLGALFIFLVTRLV